MFSPANRIGDYVAAWTEFGREDATAAGLENAPERNGCYERLAPAREHIDLYLRAPKIRVRANNIMKF